MDKTILLFTQSYPYLKAAENTFLKYELAFLAKFFDRIVIVPHTIGGEKDKISENIIVNESFAHSFDNDNSMLKKIMRGIDMRLIISELNKILQ